MGRRKLIQGETDLATLFPEVAAQWHRTKNEGLRPEDVLPGTETLIWWQCEKGHEWQYPGYRKIQRPGCPVCSGRRVVVGVNDLETTNASLALEWHSTKNGNLTPKQVGRGSARRVWWLCEKGHEWQANITHRSAGTGCPYCSGNSVLPGFNDMATLNPKLVAEWHPIKNEDLRPEDIAPGTSRKIWWLCKKGHEWVATGGARATGTSCPYCSGNSVLIGFNDLVTTNPELAAQWHPTRNGSLQANQIMAGSSKSTWWLCSKRHEWKSAPGNRLGGRGCPICSGNTVLPGFNDMATTNPELAAQWHPTKNGELAPSDVMAGTGKKIWWICPEGHEWIRSGRGTSGSGCPFCSGRVSDLGQNDLGTTNPGLAAEWHPTKNADLIPEMVKAFSNKKVWWICSQGHEWLSSVATRTAGNGCPICSGQRVLAGFNDLQTTNANLAATWHPTRNGRLTPKDVVAGSGKRFWWKCELGHEWATSGATALKRAGCPFCLGHRAWQGFNDLATTNPELAAQWNTTKNGNVTPRDFTRGSSRRAWWACSLGHEWVSIISHRSKGSGCPVCSGKVIRLGFNDLATTRPELAAEWHPTKNGNFTAQQVVAGSQKRAWWLCAEGHSWSAVISSRSAGNGCSSCAKYGYDPSKAAVLYFIANHKLHARKIGITNVGTTRLAAFSKAGWHVVLTFEHPDGAEVRKVESKLFVWLRSEHSLPQHLGIQDMKGTRGETETFSEEGPSNIEITNRIRAEFESTTIN